MRFSYLAFILAIAALPIPTAAQNSCPITPRIAGYPAGGPRVEGDWYANSDHTIWATFWGWDFKTGASEQYRTRGYIAARKVLWYKPDEFPLKVTGRRTDGEAPPLLYDIAADPRTRGPIQPSVLAFPTPGCWEIDAEAGTSKLRFIVLVKEPAQ